MDEEVIGQIVSNVVIDGTSGGIVALVSLGFRWLQRRAQNIYYRMLRWWGGDEARARIWNAYKEARDAVMAQETNNDLRLILIQDIRSEFRRTYRAYADLWN